MADTAGNPTSALVSLPPELVIAVLYFLPVLHRYNLKLAGSRYITEVVRQKAVRPPRTEYCEVISQEDAQRQNLPKGKARPALHITIERNQESLVRYFIEKYH